MHCKGSCPAGRGTPSARWGRYTPPPYSQWSPRGTSVSAALLPHPGEAYAAVAGAAVDRVREDVDTPCQAVEGCALQRAGGAVDTLAVAALRRLRALLSAVVGRGRLTSLWHSPQCRLLTLKSGQAMWPEQRSCPEARQMHWPARHSRSASVHCDLQEPQFSGSFWMSLHSSTVPLGVQVEHDFQPSAQGSCRATM